MKRKLLFLSVAVTAIAMIVSWKMYPTQDNAQVITSTSTGNLDSGVSKFETLPNEAVKIVEAEVPVPDNMTPSNEANVSKQEPDALPVTSEQVMAYEKSRAVIQAAIDRGIWEEADFLVLVEASGKMTQQQRLALEDMVGTALNQQKLVITDPRLIPIL